MKREASRPPSGAARAAPKSEENGTRADASYPWYADHLAHHDIVNAHLPPRSRHACQLLVEGCTKREIATRLGVNTRSVKKYLGMAFKAFRIRNGIRQVRLAILFHLRGDYEN